MFYVYVLELLKNNRKIFYIGYTEDLKKRLIEHSEQRNRTTKNSEITKLVYYEACMNKTDAIKREKQLKSGFGRGYLKRRLENYILNKS